MNSSEQGKNRDEYAAASTDLLCGHWTFFRVGDDPNTTARCDLPEGHVGLHKFWWCPERGDSFSWASEYERHEVRDA